MEYIILESDNLSSMFPNARINLLGYVLDSRHLFALATTLAVLPTCWLRDLSLLSYISGKNVPHAILLIRSYLIFINEIMCLKVDEIASTQLEYDLSGHSALFLFDFEWLNGLFVIFKLQKITSSHSGIKKEFPIIET